MKYIKDLKKTNKIEIVHYKKDMSSKSQIKRELISIIVDYKQTMSKDLEQALENLHDEIESDNEYE